MKFFRKRPVVTANPVEFSGEGVYQISLAELGYGLVFEDDGETGYLYVTKPDFTDIYDAVHIYNRGDSHEPKAGDEVFVVWSSDLKRAGLYYGQAFRAGVDFAKNELRSRTGFPANAKAPWVGDHSWRDEIVSGLEP